MTLSLPNVLRFAAPLLTLLSAIIVGQFFGFELALLLVAAAAFILVIWLLWTSIQSLTGETPLSFEEALSLGAPSAEEEQKRAVLRALKDLEFERSLGKISPEDYAEYSARYREQAKRLIQALDSSLGAEKERVEALIRTRLAKEGLVPGGDKPEAASDEKPKAEAQPSEGAEPEATSDSKAPTSEAPKAIAEAAEPAQPSKPPAEPSGALAKRACTACQADNELDARFCKRCGAALAKDDEQLCEHCPARYSKTLDACPECGTAPEIEA